MMPRWNHSDWVGTQPFFLVHENTWGSLLWPRTLACFVGRRPKRAELEACVFKSGFACHGALAPRVGCEFFHLQGRDEITRTKWRYSLFLWPDNVNAVWCETCWLWRSGEPKPRQRLGPAEALSELHKFFTNRTIQMSTLSGSGIVKKNKIDLHDHASLLKDSCFHFKKHKVFPSKRRVFKKKKKGQHVSSKKLIFTFRRRVPTPRTVSLPVKGIAALNLRTHDVHGELVDLLLNNDKGIFYSLLDDSRLHHVPAFKTGWKVRVRNPMHGNRDHDDPLPAPDFSPRNLRNLGKFGVQVDRETVTLQVKKECSLSSVVSSRKKGNTLQVTKFAAPDV